jgi:hypothetical protein
MRMSPVSLAIITVLTLFTGFADAKGFVYASAVWETGRFAPAMALKAAAFFMAGIPPYLLALYFLRRQGVVVAELQVMVWFVVTIVGVAVMNGRFFSWGMTDRMVAGLVLAGMLWLMVRVGG